MRRRHMFMIALALATAQAYAQSTLNDTNKWAWAASSGWINCKTDPTNGISISEYVCSGYVWSATTGWMDWGNGKPTNGVRYTNISSNDYGVNHDGNGNLRGYAWCASVGWISFENTGAPKLDLRSGVMSGYAWGGSLGWISFTNVQAFSENDRLAAGPDADSDGIPDAWEKDKTGATTNLWSGHDADSDGVSDYDEYVAGTNPTNAGSYLRITGVTSTNGTNAAISWASENTRVYNLEENHYLTNSSGWVDADPNLLLPQTNGRTTYVLSGASDTQLFLRVKAVIPLSSP